jgi:hypothetical protein
MKHVIRLAMLAGLIRHGIAARGLRDRAAVAARTPGRARPSMPIRPGPPT